MRRTDSYAVSVLRDTLSAKVVANFLESTALVIHESSTGHEIQSLWIDYITAVSQHYTEFLNFI